MVPAITAAARRSHLSSHALNAEKPVDCAACLKDHRVGPVGAAEAEGRLEVVDQVGLLLDGGEEGLVDGLLVLNTVLGGLLLLLIVNIYFQRLREVSTHLRGLALLEESILAGLLALLALGEVTGLGGLVQDVLGDTSQIDGGGGGDDIAGVDAAEGNTVDLEGTGNEEDTLGKVLEEDHTLATETASEENDDGAGLEGSPRLGRTDRLADLQ